MRSIDAPRLQPTAPWGRCSLHQSLAHHVAKDQVDGVLGNRSVHSIPNLLAGAAVLGSLEKSLLDEADVFGPEDRHGVRSEPPRAAPSLAPWPLPFAPWAHSSAEAVLRELLYEGHERLFKLPEIIYRSGQHILSLFLGVKDDRLFITEVL